VCLSAIAGFLVLFVVSIVVVFLSLLVSVVVEYSGSFTCNAVVRPMTRSRNQRRKSTPFSGASFCVLCASEMKTSGAN